MLINCRKISHKNVDSYVWPRKALRRENTSKSAISCYHNSQYNYKAVKEFLFFHFIFKGQSCFEKEPFVDSSMADLVDKISAACLQKTAKTNVIVVSNCLFHNTSLCSAGQFLVYMAACGIWILSVYSISICNK